MHDVKETVFSRHSRAGPHAHSEQLRQHAQDFYKLNQTEFQMEMEDILPPAKELLTADSGWVKRSQFSLWVLLFDHPPETAT